MDTLQERPNSFKSKYFHMRLLIFYPLKEEQSNFLFKDSLISRIISLNILNLILFGNDFQQRIIPFFQEVYLNVGAFKAITVTEGKLRKTGAIDTATGVKSPAAKEESPHNEEVSCQKY